MQVCWPLQRRFEQLIVPKLFLSRPRHHLAELFPEGHYSSVPGKDKSDEPSLSSWLSVPRLWGMLETALGCSSSWFTALACFVSCTCLEQYARAPSTRFPMARCKYDCENIKKKRNQNARQYSKMCPTLKFAPKSYAVVATSNYDQGLFYEIDRNRRVKVQYCKPPIPES